MSNEDFDPRTHLIIGAAFDVHNEVGAGSYGEHVCRDALAVEFQLRKIPYRTEVPFPIFYKGHRLPSLYRADFVCFESVIVEVKSINVRTGRLENAQMLRYLRSSGLTVALLFNFGVPSLEHRRWIMGDWQAALDTFVRQAAGGRTRLADGAEAMPEHATGDIAPRVGLEDRGARSD